MIHRGDCLEVMPTLDADSIDSIVTDPPYGLGFMGKEWDHGVPGKEFWVEALRVAKPGAHLVAFGGTRTYHRLTCAIEDAGWEIRDCLSWLYGSGFPKSHNGEWGGTALKPAWEPIILARKPLIGTVAMNVTTHGTGGLNIDGCRIGGGWENPSAGQGAGRIGANESAPAYGKGLGGVVATPHQNGRWPANVMFDEEAGKALDAQSGERTSGVPGIRRKAHTTSAMAGNLNLTGKQETGYADTGGASRFFYCAKASRSEREAGLEGMPIGLRATHGTTGPSDNAKPNGQQPVPTANPHPTVKPIALMQWLCKLVTPPGGTILDPFTGSGSTGCAAVAEGFQFVGIEREPEYAAIAEKRIAHHTPEGLLL